MSIASGSLSAELELFLQGGLGNQLIQHAYAFALSRATSRSLVVNPILLSPLWAWIRGITYRPPFVWGPSRSLQFQSLPVQVAKFLLFTVAKKTSYIISDQVPHSSIGELIGSRHHLPWLPMHGYFQRTESFGEDAYPFWCSLAFKLGQRMGSHLCEEPHIVAHVRLGDYLLPQNQHIYCAVNLERQLLSALQWRDRLGGREPIHVITDDHSTFYKICPRSFASQLYLLEPRNSGQDFLRLCQYRHIVASNSTFSLCAGQISSILSGSSSTTLLPRHWFRDAEMNGRQFAEWSRLPFVEDFW